MFMIRLSLLLTCIAVTGLAGCKPSDGSDTAAKTPSASPQGAGPDVAAHADDHGHDHDHGDHGHDHAVAGHEAGIELGSMSAQGYSVRVVRDPDEIAPGSEASFDLWITGGEASLNAVRLWIGVEDATGSIKARANVEDSSDPTHWHGHAEIPTPLPDGAKLWVELETANGKSKTAFDLK